MRSETRGAIVGATRTLVVLVAIGAACLPTDLMACGCLHSPAPLSDDEEFAVSQRAEQILFEVDESSNTVTAHVYIRYSGSPDRFAWLLPVPSVPDLGLTPEGLFAVLEENTEPTFLRVKQSLCPEPRFRCGYGCVPAVGESSESGEVMDAISGSEGEFSSEGDDGAEPVEVVQQAIVGDYQTIVFSAEEASAAVEWLSDNGFIVNSTMTPFMQPYLDMNMLFVAAKLLPGKGIDGIKPLRITYQGTQPMIPLVLTTPAADPHMTVRVWIAADEYYRLEGETPLEVGADRLSFDIRARSNYPMVLARLVDEAGGHAFVAEYRGDLPTYSPNAEVECCSEWDDRCALANNNLCECPMTDWDQTDCAQAAPGILDLVTLVGGLQSRHSRLTRLVTRISPEEMTFDPVFEPDPGAKYLRPIHQELRYTVEDCASDVLYPHQYWLSVSREACTSVYCGPQGRCEPLDNGEAGCACEPGWVAQAFTDLDGGPSITCVPEQPPTDLGLGLNLPDACGGIDCGLGTCVDRNGFAACSCDPETVAETPLPGASPFCTPLQLPTNSSELASPGAERFSEALRTLEVCLPIAPHCGPDGWLYPAPQSSNLPTALVRECGRHVAPNGARVGTSYCDGPPPIGSGPSADGSSGGGAAERGGCVHATGGLGVLALAGLGILASRRRRPGR
jgi:hypothetical protein